MAGFRDLLALTLSWWSIPNITPPCSITTDVTMASNSITTDVTMPENTGDWDVTMPANSATGDVGIGCGNQ